MNAMIGELVLVLIAIGVLRLVWLYIRREKLGLAKLRANNTKYQFLSARDPAPSGNTIRRMTRKVSSYGPLDESGMKKPPVVRKPVVVNKVSTATPMDIPTCSTVFGSAPLAVWAEGFKCPSDFLDETKQQIGGVFRFPLAPGAMAPVFVLDANAMTKLKPSNGFERTSIAEDAVASNLSLPAPKVAMKDADHDAVLFRVFRALVTKHAVTVRDQLFEQVPAALETILFGDFPAPTQTVHHEDLFKVASRSMLMSLGSAISCPEFVRDKETFEAFMQYSHNFPHIFLLETLRLPGAETMRQPLYTAVAKMEELKASFPSEQAFLDHLQPFTRDLRDATLGKLGCRFNVATDLQKTAYWGVLPLFGALLNSAATVFWLLQGILQDPGAKAAIEEEILSKFPPGKATERLRAIASGRGDKSWKGLQEYCPRLYSSLMEAARMSSAVMIMFKSSKDTTIEYNDSVTGEPRGPFKIKKHQLLVSTSLNLHYDQSVFANPSQFKWDRFMPDEYGNQRVFRTPNGTRASLMSFGFGTSVCPGRRIAMDALMTVVICMLSAYDVEIDPSAPRPSLNMNEWGVGAMTPEQEVPIIARRRVPL